MPTYTQGRVKRMRAVGVQLPGLSRKSIEHRQQPPGQHGARKIASRKSEYGRQLIEKQKLKLNYGLTERQLRNIVAEARKSKTATGAKIVELLERRLDNVVFRAGLAPTIPAARQLIRHRHLRLNDRVINMPAIRVRSGDIISARDRSRDHQMILDAIQNPPLERPEWISIDEQKRIATVKYLPTDVKPPFPIELHRVVEYYAKRL